VQFGVTIAATQLKLTEPADVLAARPVGALGAAAHPDPDDIAVTVSVAALLVTVPAELLTMTW
jgi:hypothetical protein